MSTSIMFAAWFVLYAALMVTLFRADIVIIDHRGLATAPDVDELMQYGARVFVNIETLTSCFLNETIGADRAEFIIFSTHAIFHNQTDLTANLSVPIRSRSLVQHIDNANKTHLYRAALTQLVAPNPGKFMLMIAYIAVRLVAFLGNVFIIIVWTVPICCAMFAQAVATIVIDVCVVLNRFGIATFATISEIVWYQLWLLVKLIVTG